jgi:predicted dehydrogenase
MTSILVLGAGPIAVEYSKIVVALGHTPIVVGRGAARCEAFTRETGIAAEPGGFEAFFAKGKPNVEAAIIAVGEAHLGRAARAAMDAGIRRILVEKPGGLDSADIWAVVEKAQATGSDVRVAYNRRFLASTRRAREIIAEDGGVSSFCFEFTEWSHRIEPLEKEAAVKENWFLQNSSHVVDMAFYLAGWPAELSCLVSGKLSWHPHAAYVGSGKTNVGVPFSYFADWQAPGRWWVDILTRKRRLIFRPLETLAIQPLGSVAINPETLDTEMDTMHKPGFFLQTKAFLVTPQNLMSIAEQADHLAIYGQISPGC